LHILRGSGLHGLTGLQNSDKENLFFRPFHDLEYASIVEYQEKYNIPYREDSSNEEKNYLRNYIRHEIISKLGFINKNFEHNFVKLSKNIEQYINMHEECVATNGNQEDRFEGDLNTQKIYATLKKQCPELEKKGYLTENFIRNVLLECHSLEGKKKRKELKIGNEFEIIIEKDEGINIQIVSFP
jgi:tRNA(Ile)-lysidine synthase TilS/MesJ